MNINAIQFYFFFICILNLYKVQFSAASTSTPNTVNQVNNRFWVARINTANVSDIVQLAKRNGFRFHKRVTGFENIYLFESLLPAPGTHYLSYKRHSSHVLQHEQDVEWAVQQQEIRRDKRDVFYHDEDMPEQEAEMTEEIGQEPDAPLNYRLPLIVIGNEVNYNRMTSNGQRGKAMPVRQHRGPAFNDELWDHEWYLHDTRSLPGLPKLDLNVLPVYKRGITGKGVRVAVLDDGIEYDHEDLQPNFDAEISYDCNNDHPDAKPNYGDRSNSHGTRCAGEIAMVANNKKCGVGVAFNAKIGGIKLLGGKVYDLIEGMALGYAHDKVDVYSSSWGPTDDGRSLEKPGILAQDAVKRGVKEGRDGKGCIFVWASGNGGSRQDNCNCDGYAASIYTITVGSASQEGAIPWYGEMCSAILTVTYSSGAYEDQMITTTDLYNKCTIRHTGTSASAPLAAGIIALGLESNPNTTWRDVQHLIVNSAEYYPLVDNEGWQQNAAGYWFNIRFGFGLMNADSYVSLAANWTNVGAQLMRELENPNHHYMILDDTKALNLTFENTEEDIKYLEHVEVILDLDFRGFRGALEFYLTSPHHTRVQLLGQRPRDTSTTGFKDWSLMSVATWSENPIGVWTLEIIDVSLNEDSKGILNSVILRLWGTAEQPQILVNGPRQYDSNYARNIFM